MSDIWPLLARVGLQRRSSTVDAWRSLDTLADPDATATVASLLAEKLQPHAPELVVVWEGLHSAVLGYAVGLRLKAPVVVLTDDEGLVNSATPVRSGSRAVLVAPLTPETPIARMAAGYLESRGIALVAVGVLLAGPDSTADVLSLAELPADEPAPGALPRQANDLLPAPRSDTHPRQDRR